MEAPPFFCAEAKACQNRSATACLAGKGGDALQNSQFRLATRPVSPCETRRFARSNGLFRSVKRTVLPRHPAPFLARAARKHSFIGRRSKLFDMDACLVLGCMFGLEMECGGAARPMGAVHTGGKSVQRHVNA